MRKINRDVVSLGIAVFLSGLSTTSVLAQTAKPAPAYVVLEFKVTDPEGFKDYAQRSPATVSQYGGRFLVRPGKITPVAGDAPTGPLAVLAFDSVEQAQKWASSKEYTDLVPLRDKSATTRAFIVEGATP